MSFVIRFTIHVSRFTNICRGLVVATLVLLAVWILPDGVSAQIAPPPVPPPILPLPTPLPKELPQPEPPLPSILPPAPVPERRGPMPTVKVYVREILVLGKIGRAHV